MLIDRRTLEAIAAGKVSLAFRCWKRPTVRAGGTLTTAIGMLEIRSVDVVSAAISDADARRAGYASATELLARQRSGADRKLYRIELAFVGADPRVALRAQRRIDVAERKELDGRLARMDRASKEGPWTRPSLERIEARPATLAAELAADLGMERARFKRNVRKLKALGLTESLERGYRLSPRGRAYLLGDLGD